jgi:hypothetical protein
MVDASVEFHALHLEASELTQQRLAAWIGIRLRLNDRFWRIVLKNSKTRGFENLANVACGRIQPLQSSVKSIRAPAGVFAVIDVDPRIESSETHQRL